jgi:hypothetical protein
MKKNILLESELKRYKELVGYDTSNTVTIGFKNLDGEKNKILEMHNVAKSKENVIFEQQVENDDIDQEISDEEYEDEDFLEFLKSAFKKGFENAPKLNESLILEQSYLTFLGGDFCYSNKGICKALKKFVNWIRRNKIDFDFDWLNKMSVKMGPDNFFKKIKDLFKKWRHNKRKYKRKYFEKTLVDVKGKDTFKGSRFRVGIKKYVPIGKGDPGAEKQMFSDDVGTYRDYQDDIKTPEREWDEFLRNNETKMLDLMISDSKENWAILKADNKNKGFAVYALEYFIKYQPKIGYTEILVGEDQNKIKEIINTPPNEVPGDPGTNDEVTLPIPGTFNASNLFQNNQWEIQYAANFVNMVNSYADKIAEQMESLDKTLKWKAYLSEMTLYSSASRFRNTKGAIDLSFQELSKRRLETGRDYIVETLEKIGVVIDDSTVIKLDWMANKSENVPDGNGDGTSGPNPPSGYPFIPKGNYKMTSACGATDESCEIDDKEVSRNECGKPLSSVADYDKFKFVKGDIKVVFNGEKPKKKDPSQPKTDVIPPEVTEIPTSRYPIVFLKPPVDPKRIGIPGMELKLRVNLGPGITSVAKVVKKVKTCPEAYGK